MPRKKVVSIDRAAPNSSKPHIIARDARTQRVIIGIGSQRFAIDVTTRVTKLEPGKDGVILPFSAREKGEPRTSRAAASSKPAE